MDAGAKVSKASDEGDVGEDDGVEREGAGGGGAFHGPFQLKDDPLPDVMLKVD